MCKRILVLNNMLNVLSLGAIAEKTIENVRTVVLDRVEVPMGRKQRSVSLQTGMGDFLSSVCLLAASCFRYVGGSTMSQAQYNSTAIY